MANDNKGKVLVNFAPHPKATDALIRQLNDQVLTMNEQEFATVVATHIAGFAYMMHSSNSTETIKALFCEIVEEAGIQYAEKVKSDKIVKLIKP